MKNSPLANLLAMHFREFFREPEVLFWTMVFPILLALILGLAFMRKDLTPQHIGVVAAAGNPSQGTPLHDWMENIQAINRQAPETPGQTSPSLPPIIFQLYPTTDAALVGIKRGDVLLYVRADAATGAPIYAFDPKKSDARLLYLQMKNAGPSGKVETDRDTDDLKAIGSRYIDFLIPGLIAFGILQSCLWALGWGLIDRRIKKMLRRMAATPMNKYTFLLSYLLSRLILSLVEIGALLGFAMLAFKIRVEGSWLAFLLLIVTGNIAFSGIAVLTATRAKNTQVGNGLINAVTLPMMILSGVFFSYKNFPDWAIPFIEKLPLTLLADAMRRVFIEGAGLTQVLMPSLILTLIGAACLLISQKIFRWY